MFAERKVYYLIVKKSDIEKKDGKKSDTEYARKILDMMLNNFHIEMPKIYVSEKGKPYFKDSEIFFNYSHSKNYIACAIASSEVGIDIEDTNRKISDLVSKKYLGDEKDDLKRIEIWVRKESYSKLKGLGLRIKIEDLNLDEIHESNYLIKNEKYICSIYSEKSAIFEELLIKGVY